MEHCSLWAGSPSSHLAQLDTVETKAFKIIGISHDEAESVGLSLRHYQQVDGLCMLPPLFWSCTLCHLHALSPLPLLPTSSGICIAHVIHQQPPSGETPKIQNHCSPLLICSSSSPTCGTNLPIPSNLFPPSWSSRQLLTTISNHGDPYPKA